MIDPQYLANFGTFCVDAVGGYSVSTIKLNVVMFQALFGSLERPRDQLELPRDPKESFFDPKIVSITFF